MRQLFLAIPLLIGACSQQHVVTDWSGKVYPPECRGDLSGVQASVGYISPQQLAAIADVIHVKKSSTLRGVTLNRRHILIDETLRGWLREDVLRHERCHVLKGDWH